MGERPINNTTMRSRNETRNGKVNTSKENMSRAAGNHSRGGRKAVFYEGFDYFERMGMTVYIAS